MAKLTNQQIAVRRKRMQAEALKSIAKTEQLNIRIDQKSIIRLYDAAARHKKPVGAMIREWIIDCLNSDEQTNQVESTVEMDKLVSVLNQTVGYLQKFLTREQSIRVKEQPAQYKAAKGKKGS